MTATRQATVTLGADVGGEDAASATFEHVMALRVCLEKECPGPYSPTIREFALVLRIDGSVQSWGKRGVDHVRIQKKSGYATADVFVPFDVWKREQGQSIRGYLAAEVRAAVRAIAARAAKGQVSLDSDRLIRDVDTATEKFLAS